MLTSPLTDRLLTVRDVSARMQLGRTRVYELLATGQLRSVHIGRARRVRESDLARFIGDEHASDS